MSREMNKWSHVADGMEVLSQGSKDAGHTVKLCQPVNGISAQTHLEVVQPIDYQHIWNKTLMVTLS